MVSSGFFNIISIKSVNLRLSRFLNRNKLGDKNSKQSEDSSSSQLICPLSFQKSNDKIPLFRSFERNLKEFDFYGYFYLDRDQSWETSQRFGSI